MTQISLVEQLGDFIYKSPTPFHCVENMAHILGEHGFLELKESETWNLKPHNGYFIKKGGSIIAFRHGEHNPDHKFQVIGAHTDSPCLKIKPNPDKYFENYHSLGVEVYGGVLLSTWFDRDLSIAGRVSFSTQDDKLEHRNINFEKPIAVLPNLAIHLNRTANENRTINKQLELPPILCQFKVDEQRTFNDIIAERVFEEHKIKPKEVLAFDLLLYDVQKPVTVGLNNEFFSSARLDNLLSCFLGMRALLDANGKDTAVLVCKDHEEVGSGSDTGAEGPFMRHTLERIIKQGEGDYYQSLARSFFISVDNAHGIHPNYVEKHDAQHGPLMNSGPVIKINANQRYATLSDSAAYFKLLCRKCEVPVQKFVVRSDMACGSTIGPITSSIVGIKTIDIGVPTFAMHSIRELAGVQDLDMIYKVLKYFFED